MVAAPLSRDDGPSASAARFFRQQSTKIFRDKTDFLALHHLANELWHEPCDGNATLLVGGLNEGWLARRLLDACPKITLYGFEILPASLQKARERLHGYPNVHLHQEAMGEQEGVATIVMDAGSSEMAGISEGSASDAHSMPGPSRAAMRSTLSVRTVPLATFARRHAIPFFHYVAVDVEGHEMQTLRGMRLKEPEMRRIFPVIQYEMSSYWLGRDLGSHNATRASELWSTQAAMLQSYGYRTFIIGGREASGCRLTIHDGYTCTGTGAYLRVQPLFFRMIASHVEHLLAQARARKPEQRFAPCWNVLALHGTHAPADVVSHVARHAI